MRRFSSIHPSSTAGAQACEHDGGQYKQLGRRFARRGLLTLVAVTIVAVSSSAISVPTARAVCVPDGQMSATTPPVVTGSATVGGTLATTNGTWPTPDPLTYRYQWYNDDVAIAGATSQSYVVQGSDAGSVIYAAVTAWNCFLGGRADSNSVQIADDGDEMGELEADQTAAVADDSTFTPAAPQPMTPSGPAPPGSYSTETWDPDATDTTDGLNVVSSTAPGTTALTGFIEDDNNSSPVSGATVMLSYTPCQGCTPISTSTTSDGAGSYAFLNMPAPFTYTLTIAAMTFGSYTVTNDSYAANETYEHTAVLTTSPQTYDATNEDAPDSGLAPDLSLPGTAYSQRRVPPAILVQMYDLWPHNSGHTYCTPKDPTPVRVRNYALPFYVVHVTNSEIGFFGPNQTNTQAMMSIIQNFAWFHKTKGGNYDVVNAANLYAGQCFQPKEKIPRARYNAWLALSRAIAKFRVIDGSGNLRETPYRSGKAPGFCTDPFWPAHGGTASQYGIRAHSLPTEPGGTNHCQITDWKTLALYYYPTSWSIVSIKRPPPPVTSFTRDSSSSITFHFHSRVYGKNVAWSFKLQRKLADGWHTFKTTRWVPQDHAVREYYTLANLPPTCVRYRVTANNPFGGSLPARFNGGNPINPNGSSC